MKSSVLLESGTGELEIIVFIVNGNAYCINVLKTREIIQLNEVRPGALTNKSILGLTSVRDKVMTVIDLSYILDKKSTDLTSGKMALVCEFNNQEVMFVVDSIVGIQRIKWSDITKPDRLLKASLTVGNVLTDSGILLLLDFEKIITDLSDADNVYLKSKETIKIKAERKSKIIYIAEDSKTIRALLKEVLVAAGYMNITLFDNGQDALKAIFELKEKYGEGFKRAVDLLITDIEMPILDGHTLTRRIKEDNLLSELPVVIFSSLITEDLFHKGEKVGADRQISKPSIDNLVASLDELLF
ncbi:MAG: response regulator receiver modulated CheW protein [Clostridia bacterium]|jgi:two-component system chemotaxis response regulator CheV|nr:response regulator receiver modulated CheW protein [Clostridia bacterium]